MGWALQEAAFPGGKIRQIALGAEEMQVPTMLAFQF